MRKAARPLKIVVKVTIPRIIMDNPMVEFISHDGKFHQRIPINSNIVRLLNGDCEAYFQITMSTLKILDMKRVSETEFYGKPPDLKVVKEGPNAI